MNYEIAHLETDEVDVLLDMNVKAFDKLFEAERSLDKNDFAVCRQYIQSAYDIINSMSNFLFTI